MQTPFKMFDQIGELKYMFETYRSKVPLRFGNKKKEQHELTWTETLWYFRSEEIKSY